MYLTRTLESHILRLSGSFPAVLITGPRQVGKTTLLRHLAEDSEASRRYVSLDEFAARSLAVEDPDLFLQRFPAPLILDEIQHAPGLLARLKFVVDQAATHGLYWITGSQHLPLMRGVSESLAGRIGITALMGLSLAEERGLAPSALPFRPDRPVPRHPPTLPLLPLFERIVRGSYPRFAQPNPPPLQTFYDSYVQTYIERDVLLLLHVADLAAFRRFLRLCAARTGQLLNLSDLARDTGIAVSTASEWLHLLEATAQVYLLRPYLENLSKRQIKAPKMYFCDTGLACFLAGWRTAETAASGAMAGALMETHVVSEVLRSWRHRGLEPPLWFWRTKDGQEVDLLLAEDGVLFPVEVKLTASPGAADLRGFRALARSGATVGPGAVVCLAPEPFPLDRDVEAIPVGSLA